MFHTSRNNTNPLHRVAEADVSPKGKQYQFGLPPAICSASSFAFSIDGAVPEAMRVLIDESRTNQSHLSSMRRVSRWRQPSSAHCTKALSIIRPVLSLPQLFFKSGALAGLFRGRGRAPLFAADGCVTAPTALMAAVGITFQKAKLPLNLPQELHSHGGCHPPLWRWILRSSRFTVMGGIVTAQLLRIPRRV